MRTKKMQCIDVWKMAEVLAEQVPEIKDRTACRRTLAFVGYTDEQISHYLPRAQVLARTRRGDIADILMRNAQAADERLIKRMIKK
jgi:hypothetical protein